jgi:Lamin Tail Domain
LDSFTLIYQISILFKPYLQITYTIYSISYPYIPFKEQILLSSYVEEKAMKLSNYLIIISLFINTGCMEQKEVTFDCPRLWEPTQGTVYQNPEEPITLLFSKTIKSSEDPLHSGYYLVKSQNMGPCNPACPGICIGGICQQGLVDESFLDDLSSTPLSNSRLAKTIPLKFVYSNNMVTLQPATGSLAPLTYYQLVLSGEIEDMDSLPLLDSWGEKKPFIIELITSESNYITPEISLIYPEKNGKNIPLNLTWMVIHISDPIKSYNDTSFILTSENGYQMPLIPIKKEGLCNKTDGECLFFWIPQQLDNSTGYELSIVEKLNTENGKVIPPWTNLSWFKTGNLTWAWPISTSEFQVQTVTGCFHISWISSSNGLAFIEYENQTPNSNSFLVREGEWEMAIKENHQLRIVSQGQDGSISQGPWIQPDSNEIPKPSIIISEIYPNPIGKEPAQEFIELVNISNETVELEGYRITDDLEKTGDILPPYSLEPGKKILLIGNRFEMDIELDPLIYSLDNTIIFESSLANAGLSNKGENLYLFDSFDIMESRYLGWWDLSSKEGQSIERFPLNSCDILSGWKLSSPTPGW